MPGGGASLGGLTQTVFGHQFNVGARAREELAISPKLTGVLGVRRRIHRARGERSQLRLFVRGLRRARRRSTRSLAPSSTSRRKPSLEYRPQDAWTLHARVATGFGTPQATNLFTTPQGTFGNNTQLQPQTNVGVDVGAAWRPSPTTRACSSHGFYEWFTDELVTQSAGVNLQSYTFNAPHSEHRGVEVGLDWRPLPNALSGARLYVSYLFDDQIYTRYTEPLFLGRRERKLRPRRRPHPRRGAQLRRRAGDLRPAVRPVHGSWRLPGGRPSRDGYDLDNANLLKAPGYVLLNAELHYDPPEGLGALSRARFSTSRCRICSIRPTSAPRQTSATAWPRRAPRTALACWPIPPARSTPARRAAWPAACA